MERYHATSVLSQQRGRGNGAPPRPRLRFGFKRLIFGGAAPKKRELRQHWQRVAKLALLLGPLAQRVKPNDAPFFRYDPEWGPVFDPEKVLRRLYTAMALAQPSRS